jgi:ankyrin repeat protein
MTIWRAAKAGDLDEVERLVGHDPSLLNAGDRYGRTPLMWASQAGSRGGGAVAARQGGGH